MSKEKEVVTALAAKVGIAINGSAPWDIQIHNEEFYARVLAQPYLGLGESYMDGWWDCAQLDEFFAKILRSNVEAELKDWKLAVQFLKAQLFNRQKKSRSGKVAEAHYDIGNDLYRLMLGRTMSYTCAYWKDAQNLDEAEDAKFDLVCRKIGLKPGMSVLDLGCGFGSFLKFAAEKYGIHGIGVNLSKQQMAFARESCAGLPLEFQVRDYRDAEGTFDRVVSIGLAEHVGHKNYGSLFKVANGCLADDGLFLLHTIGYHKSVPVPDPWTDKYIFPNGTLPTLVQLAEPMEKLFVLEDLHNIGADYDKTLMAWHANFVENWPSLQAAYGDRFYRMWNYYLLSCAGSFRARRNQLWQFVLSKKGVPGGYRAPR
jgi:cyclopropane-fatty-acyl-phospholipid synthase